ncbi:unnamed protein product [Blepharisma stoltei]|uniref:TmcB/TmcC TPR repeats domain-containing protein n=1 Tax=Blepharisma stoltei TaxID=1481888 RepID=A0AAU9JAK9_9CILI|nr:unnamed protein product [Blepharisma stoltei]
MNFLELLKFSTICLISFAFLFGNVIDNAFVISLFLFLVIPLLNIIIARILINLLKEIDFDVPSDPKRLANIYVLESKIRPIFCSNSIEAKAEILYFLGKCYNCSKLHENKLLAIWEANYCIFTLNDEALAKIKLERSKNSHFSLEGNYQEYLCKKVLSEFDTNESIEYLNYFQKIHDAKKEDEILCMELLDFWKEIVSIKPNLNILDDLLKSIPDSISYLDEEYSHLHLMFPKCKEVLILYSSFARNILCDTEKSTILEHKMRSIDKFASGTSKDAKSLSFFDEGNGILLGLAEQKRFGQITFANQRASEILKYPINGIIDNKLQFFIPPPYNTYTDDIFYSSLQYVSDSQIKLPKHFFLQLPNKSLIECKGKASLSCISGHLIFILVFKNRNSSHQFALISDEGEIYSHSEHFPQFVGKSNNNLRGYKLKDMLPAFQQENIKPFFPYHLSYMEIETYLIFCHSEFYSVNINYVLIINDPEEIEACRRGEFDEFQQAGKIIKFTSKNKISLNLIRSLSSDNSDIIKRKKIRKQTKLEELPWDTHIGNVDSTEVAEEHSGKSFEEEKHSNKSDNTSQHFALKRIVNLSSRSIKIFHISFVFAVIFI